jgi:predicted O-methyltransferase YrrM
MIDLHEHRVFFYGDENGVNQLFGLDYLCKKYLNKKMIACEVGSFAGVSGNLIASYVKELHCIDLWKPYIEISDENYMSEAEKRFDIIASKNNNIHKIKNDSIVALSQFPDNYFDFVYIDSWHSYEQLKKETLTALPKIKANGIIAGHDYLNIPDVGKAVNEVFKDYKIETFSDSSWGVKL